MAQETELERLVVRLMLDAEQYQKQLLESAQRTKQAAAGMSELKEKSDGMVNSLKAMAAEGLKVVSSLGILGFLKNAKQEWQAAEEAVAKLNAVLAGNERDVKKLSQDYQEFASQLQKVTVHSDETILSLLKQAESFGLTENAAKDAVKSALALAAVTDSSADGMMRMAAALVKGDLEMAMHMGRMVPQLRGIEKESEFIAKANQLIQTGLRQVSAEATTGAGRAKVFANQWADGLKEVGRLFSEIPNPIKEMKRLALSAWQGASEETKRATVQAASYGAGLLAVGPILKGVGLAVRTAFGPFSLLATAAVGGVALVVEKMGGIGEAWKRVQAAGAAAWDFIQPAVERITELWETVKTGASDAWDWVTQTAAKTWDYVKEKAIAAWEWLEPIRAALASLWGGITEAAASAWSAVGEYAVAAWEATQEAWTTFKGWWSDTMDLLSETTGITWDSIRESIVETIHFAEFTLRNFGAVAELVWTETKLGFVRFANQVEYFFKDAFPAMLSYLQENWQDVLTDIFNYGKTVFTNITENIGNLFSKIWAAITGEEVDWSEGWKGLTDGFQRASKELVLPDRVKGQLEKELEDVAEKQQDALAASWEQFRNAKRIQIGAEAVLPEEEIENVKAQTEKAAKAMDIGLTAPIKAAQREATKLAEKFDAAAFGSAEALSRQQNFKDLTAGKSNSGRTPEPGLPGAAARDSAEANQRLERQTDKLEQIRQIAQRQLDKPVIVVEAANFA